MWHLLRDRRLAGKKFRRQHPMPPYVVDFFCHEAALVIEIDGGQHAEDRRHDNARTAFLETEEVVRQVLTAPEQRLNVRSGRAVLQSRIDFHDQTYLVRVFVDIEPRPAEVVTVYRTSKTTKYWRATP